MRTTPRSIKTKLLLAVLPLVTVLAIVTVLLLSAYFKWSTRATIEKQQYTLVSLMAGKLDDQFALYRKAAITLARDVPLASLHSTAALERFLDGERELQDIFDNNIAIFTPQGLLLAETGYRPSRAGLDLSRRPYIIETRRSRQPVISAPFRIQLPGNPPVVMVTAPVLDQRGRLMAIVGGSINLLRPNLLGSLASSKIGNNGYFYLTDQDRTIIMHPDQRRILTIVAPPGVNTLYDRAIRGFEGVGETVNSTGIRMLTAYKRLASTHWILAAQLPVSEAYAPVRMAEETGWVLALFALITLTLLITTAASRLLAPLQHLIAQVAQISDTAQTDLLTVSTNDEIGRLGASFNHLLIQLRARERDLQNSRELYQFITDFSNDWIFWRIPSGEMLYISPAAEKISGYPVAELMADPALITGMIHPEDRPIWARHVCHVDRTTAPQAIEFRIITSQGAVRWLRHICMPILDGDGNLVGVRGSNDDITERKETLLTLQENEERFRLITNAAHDAIIMGDQRLQVTLWNPAAERLFGMTADAALLTPLATFIPGLPEVISHAGDLPPAGLRLELLGRNAAGKPLMLELSLSHVRRGEETCTILLARDITARKMAEQRLEYASSHDALTGLANRAAFEYQRERLDQEGPFPLAVIMADLDGLKEVNDRLGHEMGDRLITAAAALLVVPFRTQDIVARIGGDEFVVLLPGMGGDMATTKLEWLRQRLATTAQRAADGPVVSLSLGMAVADGPGQLSDALAAADQQMYTEKFTKKELTTDDAPPV